MPLQNDTYNNLRQNRKYNTWKRIIKTHKHLCGYTSQTQAALLGYLENFLLKFFEMLPTVDVQSPISLAPSNLAQLNKEMSKKKKTQKSVGIHKKHTAAPK